MIETFFPQLLLLLTTTVVVIIIFLRLHIPSSLGYLLVGVLLGSYTPGPVVEAQPVRAIAEFGIVFLLFTIGLNFSIPQIHAMRHLLLGLGTGQVFISTLVLAVLAWLLGLSPAAAFVVGAVFAQSSTTIMTSQLAAQHEENSRHGRLGTAMSVFQDVTAVPFLVIIPVLASLGGEGSSAGVLTLKVLASFAEAALVFALVFFVGRWVLKPLFHIVTQTRSTELFTLTVLVVSLVTAWITNSFGLSMAFGAFLAGMVLGETEFRHQVESTVRPFRDVLLGLFFIGIGMRFDPQVLPSIWQWAVLGAVVLMGVKTLIVTVLVKLYKIDSLTAWRTGWLMAVGGEFGFVLLALGLENGLIDEHLSQIAMNSVLLAMILGSYTIRYNRPLAKLCSKLFIRSEPPPKAPELATPGALDDHVIICGYGHIGQGVARLLEQESIPYVALDLEITRIREAHLAGAPVFYGNAAERNMLEAMGIDRARLVVITHDDLGAVHKTLQQIRQISQSLPVMIRTRDEREVNALLEAGASEVIPESLETSLMVGAHALMLLGMPISRVMRRLHAQWTGRYQLLREMFRGDDVWRDSKMDEQAARLSPVALHELSVALGQAPLELQLDGVSVAALVRQGQRVNLEQQLLQAGDVLVLFGAPAALQQARQALSEKRPKTF